MLSWEKRAAARIRNEKRSNDLFSYLCDHTTQVTYRSYDVIERRRSNILTVMSFCLLGEMTFVASNTCAISSKCETIVLIAVSLLTWTIAFFLAAFTDNNRRGWLAVPGGDERLDYLPNSEDRKKCIENNDKPGDVPKALIVHYLERTGHPIEADISYSDAFSVYRKQVASDKGLDRFNRNAWLGLISHMQFSAYVKQERIKAVFTTINILFLLNLLSLFICIIICLF